MSRRAPLLPQLLWGAPNKSVRKRSNPLVIRQAEPRRAVHPRVVEDVLLAAGIALGVLLSIVIGG